MKTVGYWLEAMRLRTLPVSAAGVLMAVAFNIKDGTFDWLPAVICLLFAILAQISSNFANEYFDYTSGRDRPGREGPRRGVTEGEIRPEAMKRATLLTLGAAGCVGLSLVGWGGLWLIFVGIFIALGVFAYSAGPYPLSTHGWGEAAVVFFFGIIPVNLTYYVQAHEWAWEVMLASVAVGLMGSNVLIVNNYRDEEDDRRVGKVTLCVRCGRKAMRILYMCDAVAACLLLLPVLIWLGWRGWPVGVGYVVLSWLITKELGERRGHELTPLLGMTSMLMSGVSVCLLVLVCLEKA